LKSLAIIALFSASLLCHASTPAANNEAADEPGNPQWVRVRLQSNLQNLHIEGRALQFQNRNELYQPVAIPRDEKNLDIQILAQAGKKMWSVRQQGLTAPQTFLFAEKYLLIQGQDMHIGAQRLPDKVFLSQSSNHKVDLIGLIPLDDYITGVLASEMPLSWPLETLKAQAVAIRSYSLAVMKERKNKPFQLESSILDQVFRPLISADKDSPLIQKAILAVQQTEGVKLTTANSQILKAYYHADCGGKTTNAQNVWGQAAPTEVVVDSFCPSNSRAHWSLEVSVQNLEAKLKKFFPGGADALHLQSLNLIQPQAHERVQKVAVLLADGRKTLLSANEFRGLLGYDQLKSSLFEMKKSGDLFVFKGKGFGHGVGLCQWGSRTLGLRGWTYQAILKHYYPSAQIDGGTSLAMDSN